MSPFFSHNPTITELAIYLSGDTTINMTTAAVAVIEFENWEEISFGSGELIYYDFPKKHLE